MNITKLNRELIKPLENYLQRDPVKNAYIIDALRREKEKSDFYIAFESSMIQGVLLTYRGYVEGASAIFRGTEEAVYKLFDWTTGDERDSWISCWVAPRLSDYFCTNLKMKNIFSGKILYADKLGVRERAAHKVEILRKFDSASIAQTWKGWIQGTSLDELEKSVEQGMSSNVNTYFGVKVDGDLISTACTTRVPPHTAILRRVYTEPEYRNNGYGTAVVTKALTEELKTVDSVCLITRGKNESAQQLYEKLSFKKHWEFDWLDLLT